MTSIRKHTIQKCIGKVLINAGYIYDSKLMQLLKHYHREIPVEMFDESHIMYDSKLF